ncbi:MAG: thiamine phosphate synthase [Microcystaceae cyanobacterium]
MNFSTQPRAIARILDANLDRSREGLRIIEEWCRFAQEEAVLADRCKQMRQELARWHDPSFRLARDTVGDVGTALSHPQEETRQNIQQLLLANFGRVQEALRVLEEYGKLINPEMGIAVKQMRYQVYSLESDLLSYQRLAKLKSASLYLVTSPQSNILEVVESALKGGLTLVQYRDKDTEDYLRFPLAQKLCKLCHQYDALFIINDRLDLALAVNADGLHLGQQDLPIQVARQLLGPQILIGRSTTNPTEMARAIAEGADYIGVGPVYATPTKIDKKATGLDYVNYAQENATLPWFAIGGIDQDNITDVIKAGASQIAVVRAIMQAENPEKATQLLLQKFD